MRSEIVRKQNENIELKKSLHLNEGYHGILGDSPIMKSLYELCEYLGSADAPVLIYGESGTGKELFARAVHEVSGRSHCPFIKVNCASLNENLFERELFGHVKGAYTCAEKARVGRFEAAHEGTIFLDEIGDIPLSTQVKLLRVLDEMEKERIGDHRPIKFDARIVSATNKDLEELIQKGLFREDLFFRINVFPLRIPPLRERKEDIPSLVQFFIKQNNERRGKSIIGVVLDAMATLMEYGWPGNVRELRNSIEYAFVLCSGSRIELNHLPSKVISAKRNFDFPRSDKKLTIEKVLEETDGNRTEAARRLGISRVTLWKLMKKFEIAT